jgi:hypothetical protein
VRDRPDNDQSIPSLPPEPDRKEEAAASAELEFERALPAGATSEPEPASAIEVAPAGSTIPAEQPSMDLTTDPFHSQILRPRFADPPAIVMQDEGDNEIKIGNIFSWISKRKSITQHDDGQAAATSQLNYVFAGVGTGVTSTVVSWIVANPSGLDLVFIGVGTGGGVFMVGLGLNIIRFLRGRKKR